MGPSHEAPPLSSSGCAPMAYGPLRAQGRARSQRARGQRVSSLPPAPVEHTWASTQVVTHLNFPQHSSRASLVETGSGGGLLIKTTDALCRKHRNPQTAGVSGSVTASSASRAQCGRLWTSVAVDQGSAAGCKAYIKAAWSNAHSVPGEKGCAQHSRAAQATLAYAPAAAQFCGLGTGGSSGAAAVARRRACPQHVTFYVTFTDRVCNGNEEPFRGQDIRAAFRFFSADCWC